jgi:uncharacterized membrane protein
MRRSDAQGGKKMATREFLFRVSISLKGLHAVLEIVGGVALLLVTPGFIVQIVGLLTQDELAEDPDDRIAGYLLHAAQQVSVSSELFAALYLLSHGIVKGLLVIALLQHRLWAYPLSVAVFLLFIAYQCYRFTITHALGLVVLSVFDLLVVALIWIEYRALIRSASRHDREITQT